MFTRWMIGKIMNKQFARFKSVKFNFSGMVKYLESISNKNCSWVFK